MDSVMEDSVFDDNGASSDDFTPAAAPKAKAKPRGAPKKTATAGAAKVAAKGKTQTTLTVKATAPKKRSRSAIEDDDSDVDGKATQDGSVLSVTPPKEKKQKKAAVQKKAPSKPLQVLENDAPGDDGAARPTPKKGSSATDKYQKLTQLEHILKRPDTYIGSVERTEKQMWVYNSQTEAMEMREVSYVPGLYKIFDEILVNAADNKQNDKNMDTIKVRIDRETGEISVWNNGRGIPIEMHQKEKMYIPEMIFGHLLTSSNYDDDQHKVTGGRNGYGAKLCNIFSSTFTVETADSRVKQKYKQTWTANMSQMGKAQLSAYKKEDFTQVTFTPDFNKFGMAGIDDDFEALVKRRVYDLAGTLHGVKVILNDEKIKIRNFKQYVEMYVKAIDKENGEGGSDSSNPTILTEQPDPRWEIGFAVSDGSFQQVSFVNSIATTSGGTHVNYVGDQIVDRLLEVIKKKNKGGAALKNNQIRNHIFLFVNCQIVNPAFTSQTKEQLTTKQSQFGSKCVVSDEFLKKVAKSQAVNNILHFAQQKADQVLKKSDGSRRSRMNNPKLEDANKAGTKEGWKCTLILTEGESAKGLAMAGRAVVGSDEFGVFPLRGKLLNVRDATIDQISKNAEIQAIKQIIGLQHKKEYTDTKSLRYGHIMIMTDQDHDGSHIKGLLINFLQCAFPSLLKIPQFLIEFITPIVKVWKGDPKNPRQLHSFFTIPEYETWKEAHQHERGWEQKYYKGLGTSTTEDAQVYFRDLDRHLKEFHTMQENEEKLIDLAFSKKKADDRKEWLRQFKPGTYLDHSIDKISYTDFINKELILYSMADNMRSIPSMIDGLKPGQRKVMYTCFRRNLVKDMKVVELAGLVSGLTAYHHGDTSLQQTIVGLAQTFIGSNNINCLEPSGNFGSRLQGGSDCASARYIYTRLSPFARRVFSPLDEPLLTYNVEDGEQIEPETYCPTVPLVLINGADGIGTGWSSQIPNYNPEDVVANLRRLMKDEKQVPMTPWFRGWAGEMKQIAPDRFKFSGVIKQTGDNEIEITELPIRMWTQDFKEKLEDIIRAEKVPSFIKDYRDYNTHVRVHFIIQMEEKHMKIALQDGLEEKFKLAKVIPTSNLVAFDKHGRLHKYNSPEEIMEEFYSHRLILYEKRKAHQLAELQKMLEKMTNQARFIQMIISGELVVSKKKKADLVAELKRKGFKPFPKVKDAAKEGEMEPVVEAEQDADDPVEAGASAYDYLLGMAIWSLTQERVDKLFLQIGEKEQEIDTLIKLSAKDLWTRDLDDFIAEWRFQLDDEAKRQKKVANYGRRASNKLKLAAKGPGARKAKAKAEEDDSDYEVAKPKKSTGPIRVQPKPVSSFFTALKSGNAPPKAVPTTSQAPVAQAKPAAARTFADGSSDPVEVQDEAVRPSDKAKKPSPAETVGTATSDANGASKAPARKSRLAASKPIKYGEDSGSDSDNGDDLLGDVSKMVKGIGAGADNSKLGTKPLFAASTSKIVSSIGVTKAKEKRDPAPAINLLDDDTDFSLLAPKPAVTEKASATVSNGNRHLDAVSDESGEDAIVAPAPAKTTSTAKAAAAAKAKRQPAANGKKPAATTKAAKPTTLSPAAKAYAAKRGPKKRVIESESDESDFNDDDDEPIKKPAGRATGKGHRKIVSSDKEDSDVEMSDAPPNPPARQRPAAAPAAQSSTTASARPARRAAAATASKKASKYVELSSDSESEAAQEDEEDEGEDYSDGDSE